MEVAGLAFGVFPVVCQLLQQYEQGAQFVSNYKHFRTEYKRFILDVRYQQRELQELLYTLMCSGPEAYITDITRKEFLAMVSKEEFKGWKDPQLFKLWEKRLDEDYQFVAEGLNDVFGTFSELEKRLEIQELHPESQAAAKWQYNWERARQTWFRAEDREKCEKMGTRIEQMKKLVATLDQEREEQIGSNTIAFVRLWTTAVGNATYIYNKLNTAWRCHCDFTHKAMLSLRSLTAESPIQREKGVSIIFALSSLAGIDYKDFQTTTHRSTEWEVYFRSRTSVQSTHTSHVQRASKPTDKLQSLSIHDSIPQSNLSIPEDTKTKVSLTSSARIHKSDGNKATKDPKSQLNMSKLFKPQSVKSFWSSDRRHKEAKAGLSPTASTEPPMVSSDISLKPFQVQEHMLPSSRRILSPPSLAKNASVMGTVSPDASLLVSPEALEIDPSHDQEQAKMIPDLCNALRTAKIPSCLGYLGEEQDSQTYFELFCTKSFAITAADPRSTTTLTDVLASVSQSFSPHDAARVALTLAKAVLQLHQTQWVINNWTTDHVFFRVQNDEVIFRDMYFAKDFPSVAVDSTVPLLSQDKDAELQKSTKRQATAQIIRLRNSLECLGIVLVQLSFGSLLESLDEFTQLEGSIGKGKSTGRPSHVTMCAFARDLGVLDTISAREPEYHSAIECCMSPQNVTTVSVQSYEKVVQRLHDGIITPLDKLAKRWQ